MGSTSLKSFESNGINCARDRNLGHQWMQINRPLIPFFTTTTTQYIKYTLEKIISWNSIDGHSIGWPIKPDILQDEFQTTHTCGLINYTFDLQLTWGMQHYFWGIWGMLFYRTKIVLHAAVYFLYQMCRQPLC